MVNYLSENLLKSISESYHTSKEHIVLLNRNGYFLKGVDRNEEWGFMYPEKTQMTFENKFPGLWEKIISKEKGYLINGFGVFTFDTVFPLRMDAISSTGATNAFTPSKSLIFQKEYQWKLVHYISNQDLLSSFASLKKNTLILSALVSLILSISTWFLSLSFHKKRNAEIDLKTAHDDLAQRVAERVKELKCLYEMSQLSSSQTLTMQQILDQVIKILPDGFCFPGITQCRIRLDKVNFGIGTFNSDHYILEAPLSIAEKIRGKIQVRYTMDKPMMDEGPFLEEERALINFVATQICVLISKKEEIREKEKFREQLFHSQKMEAIGLLAGGIAHDFNNILTVINGFAELGKLCINDTAEVSSHFDEIVTAGHKASNLTRQLLVFSRKDAIQTGTLQLNDAVKNTIKLLSRLVGENIQIKLLLDPKIPAINADPTQVDQLLFNIIINARDAINTKTNRTKSVITVTTDEILIDQKSMSQYIDIKEGRYILLEISDTGTGMTKEIQEKIFTPFFSTKPKKKGTGLGLSTVYGIVKQNHGNISVYSEKGMGTTFKIFWPIIHQGQKVKAPAKSPVPHLIDFEKAVVLVVEDDPRLNAFVCNALKSKKVSVLKAFSGEQALELIGAYQTGIDLLFTDVILPGMTGKELAEEVTKKYPDIKVLYTSGYTQSHFAESGILSDDINFLKKPYAIQHLFQKVTEVLSGDN